MMITRCRRAAVVLGTIAATLLGMAGPARADLVSAAGPLVDMAPDANPTDGARAEFYSFGDEDGTSAILVLTGLDESFVGNTYGAHVHVGPCTPGRDTTGGHYNIGGPPSPETEVWLDFTVELGGFAISATWVPFDIPPGAARSVTVHRNPTDPDTGAAGGKIACLPVEF